MAVGTEPELFKFTLHLAFLVCVCQNMAHPALTEELACFLQRSWSFAQCRAWLEEYDIRARAVFAYLDIDGRKQGPCSQAHCCVFRKEIIRDKSARIIISAGQDASLCIKAGCFLGFE